MENKQIHELAASLKQYSIDCRRKVHRFAEVAAHEVKTSAFIQQEIRALGLPYEKVSTTGLLAVLDTGRPGPHIALRCDIDALPVAEEPNNLVGPRVCVSDDPTTCHACGHDAHTAVLLAVMKALVWVKEELNGSIYFCFEEGEEVGTGYQGMLDALAKRPVDVCYGMHVLAGLEAGTVNIEAGPRMASTFELGMKVLGKSGHSSRPDLAHNAVFCAANIVTNLGAVWANAFPSGEALPLGITTIQGGGVYNAFPESAYINGTVRYYNEELGKKAEQTIRKVALNTADMYDCSVEFTNEFYHMGEGPLMNDPRYSALAYDRVKQILPEGAMVHCAPWIATESFGIYSKQYPAVFAFVGIKNDAFGSGADHHNAFFDIDESALDIGIKTALGFVDAVQKDQQ